MPLKANMDFQQQNLKLDHMKQTNQTNKNTVSFAAQIRAGLMTPSSSEKFTIKNTAIYRVTLELTYTSFSHINKNSVKKDVDQLEQVQKKDTKIISSLMKETLRELGSFSLKKAEYKASRNSCCGLPVSKGSIFPMGKMRRDFLGSVVIGQGVTALNRKMVNLY